MALKRVVGGGRRKNGARTVAPRTGQTARNCLHFIIAGGVIGARATFGAFGATVTNLARILEPSEF